MTFLCHSDPVLHVLPVVVIVGILDVSFCCLSVFTLAAVISVFLTSIVANMQPWAVGITMSNIIFHSSDGLVSVMHCALPLSLHPLLSDFDILNKLKLYAGL